MDIRISLSDVFLFWGMGRCAGMWYAYCIRVHLTSGSRPAALRPVRQEQRKCGDDGRPKLIEVVICE